VRFGCRGGWLLGLGLVGCRAPTQVTVELTTDVDCAEDVHTTLQVGSAGSDVEGRSPKVDTVACQPGGRIGSVVLVPSGANNAEFAVKAVLAHGSTTLERCARANAMGQSLAGCIVARREARFVPHDELTLPIAMLAECETVACPAGMTCVHRQCVPATGAPGAPPNDDAGPSHDAPPNDDAPPNGDGRTEDVVVIGPVESGATPPEAGQESSVGPTEGGAPDAAGPGPGCPAVSSTLCYVDPVAGTDSPMFGGGPGPCAYRTVTYALTQPSRMIMLPSGTYSPSTGEKLPFVLHGEQELFCLSTTSVLSGKGRYAPGAIDATVVFEGYLNKISSCALDGAGQPGVCLEIATNGSVTSAHSVFGADFGHCGDAAIQVDLGVGRVDISTSRIHDNAVGVLAAGANTGVDIFSNKFLMNGVDIACRNDDPGVTGDLNTNAGNYATCETCANCPF
jgi:hypothetical protein